MDYKKEGCKINALLHIGVVDNLSTRECKANADRGKRQQKSGKQTINQEKERKNKKLYTIEQTDKYFSTFSFLGERNVEKTEEKMKTARMQEN